MESHCVSANVHPSNTTFPVRPEAYTLDALFFAFTGSAKFTFLNVTLLSAPTYTGFSDMVLPFQSMVIFLFTESVLVSTISSVKRIVSPSLAPATAFLNSSVSDAVALTTVYQSPFLTTV